METVCQSMVGMSWEAIVMGLEVDERSAEHARALAKNEKSVKERKSARIPT